MSELSRIPFSNLDALHARQRKLWETTFSRVLENSQFIGGKTVADFESAFAGWIGGNCYVAGCANGTDAITLAARALNLPSGSEAIVPAMTYVGTVEGLLHAGLEVRLADVNAAGLLDAETAAQSLTPQTRLIVPVHLYGQMAPMDQLRTLAEKSDCVLLEDAAQAHGARWQDKPVGHWSEAATYSFYPGKNLGAFGDAGAVLSKNSDLVNTVRRLGNHGGLQKHEHLVLGANSRIDALQAAILTAKLEWIDEWNEARRNLASCYRECLAQLPEVELPLEQTSAHHVYHLFVIRVAGPEALAAFLEEGGIETGRHYPRAIHQLPALREKYKGTHFPTAEDWASRGISLPLCPTMSPDIVERVAARVKEFYKR